MIWVDDPCDGALDMRAAVKRAALDRHLPMALIQKAVAARFDVSPADLVGDSRRREFARPRQVGMFLARALTGKSYGEIARRFGRSDHTTAIHAVRTIEALCGSDIALSSGIEALTSEIKEARAR